MISSILELLVLSVPSLLWVRRQRRRDVDPRQAWAAPGLRFGALRYYLVAIVLVVVFAPVTYLVLRLVPADVMRHSHLAIGEAASVTGYLAIAFGALAEEIFFRGFVAGLLMRRFGFAVGNGAQALIFLAPHFLLLLVSTALWPLLPLQLAAGWLAGWLRHRSGSIGPGWLMHGVTNMLTPLLIAA